MMRLTKYEKEYPDLCKLQFETKEGGKMGKIYGYIRVSSID